MEIAILDQKLSVCAQPTLEAFEDIGNQGFTLIINNRPDGESEDQPTGEQERTAAQAAGMDYEQMPVTQSTLTPELALAFREKIMASEGKVVAHCKSGTRSTILWAMGEALAGTQSPGEIISRAKNAGIDISHIAPVLTKLVEQRE